MMTLQDLQQRIQYAFIGYGTYKVWTTHRGRKLSCISHNTLAIDRINSDDWVPARKVVGFYTLRGAYKALHYEVVEKGGEV